MLMFVGQRKGHQRSEQIVCSSTAPRSTCSVKDKEDRADKLQAEIVERAGMNVAMGSDACMNALKCFGDIKRIAVVTPYMPVGDKQVERYFTECGFEVVQVKGLKCGSPVLIAHETEKALRDAINEVNDPSVEAIVQAGTNLAMARVGGIAEF